MFFQMEKNPIRDLNTDSDYSIWAEECCKQAKLKELHPCGNTPKEHFEIDLKQLGKAFIVFRYSYERRGLAWNAQFLIELLETLRRHIITD